MFRRAPVERINFFTWDEAVNQLEDLWGWNGSVDLNLGRSFCVMTSKDGPNYCLEKTGNMYTSFVEDGYEELVGTFTVISSTEIMRCSDYKLSVQRMVSAIWDDLFT